MSPHYLIGIALLSLPMASQAQEYRNEVSLDQYLYALGQITPSAREGAEVYLHAFQRNCAKPLTVIELRKAIAEGDGDPVLMSMIRATQLKDSQAMATLSRQVACHTSR